MNQRCSTDLPNHCVGNSDFPDTQPVDLLHQVKKRLTLGPVGAATNPQSRKRQEKILNDQLDLKNKVILDKIADKIF